MRFCPTYTGGPARNEAARRPSADDRLRNGPVLNGLTIPRQPALSPDRLDAYVSAL